MARARRRFGQHFLVDPGVIDAIVDAIAPAREDVLVEIGPGRGAITEPLVRRCGRFHGIELDRDLAAALARRYADTPHVTIHEADALRFDFATLGGNLRVVGNLPYNVSTPLLFHLLDARAAIADMHVMLQNEVVERMAASPGVKAYGRLGIMLGCFFDIEPLFTVPPEAFEPAPEVVSAVVRLRPLPDSAMQPRDAGALSALLARAFSQRRKTLRNALRDVAADADFAAVNIDPRLRPENIAIEDWIALSDRLATATDNASRTR